MLLHLCTVTKFIVVVVVEVISVIIVGLGVTRVVVLDGFQLAGVVALLHGVLTTR